MDFGDPSYARSFARSSDAGAKPPPEEATKDLIGKIGGGAAAIRIRLLPPIELPTKSASRISIISKKRRMCPKTRLRPPAKSKILSVRPNPNQSGATTLKCLANAGRLNSQDNSAQPPNSPE